MQLFSIKRAGNSKPRTCIPICKRDKDCKSLLIAAGRRSDLAPPDEISFSVLSRIMSYSRSAAVGHKHVWFWQLAKIWRFSTDSQSCYQYTRTLSRCIEDESLWDKMCTLPINYRNYIGFCRQIRKWHTQEQKVNHFQVNCCSI